MNKKDSFRIRTSLEPNDLFFDDNSEPTKSKKKSVQKFIEDMQATLNQKKIINKSHTE